LRQADQFEAAFVSVSLPKTGEGSGGVDVEDQFPAEQSTILKKGTTMRSNATVSSILASLIVFFFSVPASTLPIVWPVDDLTRVLPTDSPPPPSALDLSIILDGARGEFISFGMGIYDDEPIFSLETRVSRLSCPEQRAVITVPSWVHLARTVPVEQNTKRTPPDELAFQAPADVPDPLVSEFELPLPADRVTLFWVTLQIPRNAPAGRYTGTVTITPSGRPVAVPIAVDVYGFEIPEERHLKVTMWFSDKAMCRAHGTARFSDKYWRLLKAYAEAMAQHRQNVFLVPLDLIRITEERGELVCDFERFDRYIETFLSTGLMDLIELGHLGHFGSEGWNGPDIVWRKFTVEGADDDELQAERIVAALLKQLVVHLKERGWLERSAIHVADEPSVNNLPSWKEHSAFVGRLAPDLRRIDAVEAEDFEGFLEIWVPKLHVIEPWKRPLQKAAVNGNEIWFYTCLHPYGVYPNRLLDNTLFQVRLLPWMAARYNLKGYLHWGLNHWTDEPYQKVASGNLPPGDNAIIYPGENGPVSSIRWEVFRDGLEDYEYLWVLQDRLTQLKEDLGVPASFLYPAQRVQEFVARVAPDAIYYSRDPRTLRDLRHAIGREIDELNDSPLLLVQTSPPEGTELGAGPATVIVRGITDPGAEVTVNRREIKPDTRGYFAAHIMLSPDKPDIRIVAESSGSRREIKRKFVVIDRVLR